MPRLTPPTVSRLTEDFSVILVPEAEPRNRHGNPGRKEAYLFDLDVRIKSEHDYKKGHEDDKREVEPEHDHKIGGVIW